MDLTELVVVDSTTNIVQVNDNTVLVEISDTLAPPTVIEVMGGVQGVTGPVNTLSVGTVTASAPGSSPVVTITGQAPSQTLNLTLPRGDTGPANTLTIGTVTQLYSGQSPTAGITGTAPNQTLNLSIPKGAEILAGAGAPAAGTGSQNDWYINTSTWDMSKKTSSTVWTTQLNIRGATGPANTLTVNPVTTLDSTQSPTVTIGGTSPNQNITFSLPKGAEILSGSSAPTAGTGQVGDLYINTTTWDMSKKTNSTTWTLQLNIRGATGPAPNLAIGTTTTGNPGTSAAASITGSNPNYSLNLTIPKGDVGSQWYTGTGAPSGATGVVGDFYIVTGGITGLGDVYKKTGASTWTLQGNIRGASGAGNVSYVNTLSPDGSGNVTLTNSTMSPDATNINTASATGDWSKFVTMSSSVVNADAEIVLDVIGAASSTPQSASVLVKLRNAPTLGAAPIISLNLLSYQGMTTADFIAVTTVNDGTNPNTVEFYVRRSTANSYYSFFERGRKNNGAATFTYAGQNSSWSAALPAGTQTTATYATLQDGAMPTRLGPSPLRVADFNDATDNGWYGALPAATNAPVAGQYWTFQVVNDHSTKQYVTQIAFAHGMDSDTDSYKYKRSMDAGVWGSWIRIREQEPELDARYTTLSTTQTISGIKTFSSTINTAKVSSQHDVVGLSHGNRNLELRSSQNPGLSLHKPGTGAIQFVLASDASSIDVMNSNGDGYSNLRLNNMLMGTTTSTAVATPLYINMGGTYGSGTAGVQANQKLKIHDNGTASYGLGVSSQRLEYQVASGAQHSFYVNAVNVGNVNSTGFAGDGSQLTNLTATNLAGTINDTRLSSNVVLLNNTQTISGFKTISYSKGDDRVLYIQNTNTTKSSSVVFGDDGATKFLTVGVVNTASDMGSTFGNAGEGFIRSSTSAAGLALSAVTGPIRFLTGSGAERVTIASNGNVTNAGALFNTGPVEINNGGQSLSLKPGSVDHVYMAFFARTATPTTRSAYIGYGGAAGTQFTMTNEISGGAFSLSTTGNGNINLNAGTGSVNLTGTLNGSSAILTGNVSVSGAANRFTINHTTNVAEGLYLSQSLASADSPRIFLGADANSKVWTIRAGQADALIFSSAATINSTSGTQRVVFANTGNVQAASFTGDGATLTGLNGSNISTGTVADARLPSRINNVSGSLGAIDINTVSNSGWYSAINTSTNTPTAGGYWNLFAIDYQSANYTTQIASEVNSKTLHYRQQTAGTYGAWQQILTSTTSINGSNIGSGTIAPARLGSGASATTFLRGDSTFQTLTLADIPDAWVKRAVRAASTANVAIPPGGTSIVIDGVTLANGDRVLLKNQTTTSQNGIYTVGGVGTSVTLTRSTDADTTAEIAGGTISIDQGTQGGQLWSNTLKTTDTLGTTSMLWYREVDTSMAGVAGGYENFIAAGVSSQFYRGDKSWSNSLSSPSTPNDTPTSLFNLQGGTDGTLGATNLIFGVNTSATAANRYGFIAVGDTAASRTLVLGRNPNGAYGNVNIGFATTKEARLTVVASANVVTPTLGSASGASVQISNADSTYGTIFGTAGTGVGWIQQMRTDGTATAYNILLQPSGGNVGIGGTAATEKLEVTGNIKSSGTITSAGTGFSGPGVNITTLNASNLSTGTIPITRSLTASTQNSSNTFNNYYSKVCTVTLNSQFNDANIVWQTIGGASGSATSSSPKITFRVKQQNAMASAPSIELEVEGNYGFWTPNKFVAVTTQNDATATVVSLYAQFPQAYEQLWFYEIARQVSTGTVTQFAGDTPVVSLPAGTQTAAVDGNDNQTSSILAATKTVSGAWTFSAAPTISANALNMTNGTSNLINMGAAGVAAPTFTSRSAGTKVVLYQGIGGASADYAIGIETSHIWQSVATNSASLGFKWYGGTTNVATLTGTGALTVAQTITTAGNIIVGNATSSATATPLNINLGGTYGTNTVGTNGNLKAVLFDNGTAAQRYGFGVSSNRLEYQAGQSGSQHSFYVSTSNIANITSSGVNVTGVVQATATTNSFNTQRFIFTTAGQARPTGTAYVEWVGPVEPTNAIDGDTWVNTAS